MLLLDDLVLRFLLLDDIVESLLFEIFLLQIAKVSPSDGVELQGVLVDQENFFLLKFLAVSLPVFGLGEGLGLFFLEVVEVPVEDIDLVVESLDRCVSLVEGIPEGVDLVAGFDFESLDVLCEVSVGGLLPLGELSDSVLEVIDVLLALLGEFVELGFEFSDLLISFGDFEFPVLDFLPLLIDDVFELSLADLEEVSLVGILEFEVLDAGSQFVYFGLVLVLFHGFLSDELDSLIGVPFLVLIFEFFDFLLVVFAEIQDLFVVAVFELFDLISEGLLKLGSFFVFLEIVLQAGFSEIIIGTNLVSELGGHAVVLDSEILEFSLGVIMCLGLREEIGFKLVYLVVEIFYFDLVVILDSGDVLLVLAVGEISVRLPPFVFEF